MDLVIESQFAQAAVLGGGDFCAGDGAGGKVGRG